VATGTGIYTYLFIYLFCTVTNKCIIVSQIIKKYDNL